MTPQSDVLHDFPAESRALTLTEIPFGRSFFWSVRRELWENHSLYIAPAAVAALFLVGFSIAIAHLRTHVEDSMHIQPDFLAVQPYSFAAIVIMATSLIVGFFYCLDALYGERRDRSILFWKSLPVSDLTTVLAKAIIPILVLPLITFVVTLITQAVMLLIAAVVLAGTGLNDTTHAPLLRGAAMLLYHLVVLHGLYYAPIFAWLLLISAWARKAPLLWAVLPPLAVSVFEVIAFHTTYFAHMLGNRIGGGDTMNHRGAGPHLSMNDFMPSQPLQFLFSPGMIAGLVIAALLLVAAMRVRRFRTPI